MKATVDRYNCIGCGLCESVCSTVFVIDDEGLSKVIVDVIPQESETCAKEASYECPVSVITIEA